MRILSFCVFTQHRPILDLHAKKTKLSMYSSTLEITSPANGLLFYKLNELPDFSVRIPVA